jgi:transposase
VIPVEVGPHETGGDTGTDAAARIAALESALAERDVQIIALVRERDELRAAYDRLWLDVELMRRRIFIAKAERANTTQLELEFKDKLAELDKLAGTIGIGSDVDATNGKAVSRPRPKGRRDLRQIRMPEERVEMSNSEMEALVAKGQAERIGFEESSKIAWQRGGPRHLIVARVKYRVPDVEDESPETTRIVTTPMPPEIFPRALASVSLIAHIIVDKYCDGIPLHRQEDRFTRLGLPIDRGTMCRWVEHAGATADAAVIAAMRADAMSTAFCISTDATGVLVQPLPDKQKGHQPCRRGHYFVQIADRDHVFFEYTARETSAAVREMFKSFSGYVQADAKSVYDILFRPPPEDPPDDAAADLAERTEVGCLSHARRKLWEATIAKCAVAREGLARIGRVFALERNWKKHPAHERKALRQTHARPHLEAFFDWADVEFARVKDQRGLLRSALGYCVRHKAALMRYIDDGRLEPTNNGAERELRRIAVGRHAWLFFGSDDHAQSAGNLFSLVASARLHKLDPEQYVRDVLRVLPHWPAIATLSSPRNSGLAPVPDSTPLSSTPSSAPSPSHRESARLRKRNHLRNLDALPVVFVTPPVLAVMPSRWKYGVRAAGTTAQAA